MPHRLPGSAEASSTDGNPRRSAQSPQPPSQPPSQSQPPHRPLPAAVRSHLAAARRQLSGRGWTLLPGVPFLSRGEPDEHAVLDLASRFGVPSARDGGRVVWPVAPTGPSSASSPRATFSTRAGAAGFHTDAQYHDHPEDYVCLFVVRPASDGGLTRLLPVETAIFALKTRSDSAGLVDLMSRPLWRWRIPAEFAVTAPVDAAPFPALPAAGSVRIRWRSDNLDPALPGPLHDAASLIDTVFNCAQGAVELRLRPGDVLIVDNHRVMHARTWFSDPRRLLLRVRLWRP